MSSTDTSQEHVVMCTEHDPITILDTLPRTVFPVSARVELGRTIGDDTPYTEYSSSGDQSGTETKDGDGNGNKDRDHPFPVTPRRPEPIPYIPETTIYFTNPAERAPSNRTAWLPRDCADGLTTLRDHIRRDTNADVDRLQLADESHETWIDEPVPDGVAGTEYEVVEESAPRESK